MDEPYEVALSLAGEDREYVEQVALGLKSHGVRVFYDMFQQADLWGKNLGEELGGDLLDGDLHGDVRVRGLRAEGVDEARATECARQGHHQQVDSVLPARFDDVDVPGLSKTVGYINLQKTTPTQLVDLLLQKLGRASAMSPPWPRAEPRARARSTSSPGWSATASPWCGSCVRSD